MTKKKNINFFEKVIKRRAHKYNTFCLTTKIFRKNDVFALENYRNKKIHSEKLMQVKEKFCIEILQNGNNTDLSILKKLINVKNLLSSCLPEMPSQHILKLIYNFKQITLTLWNYKGKKRLLGTLSGRYFKKENFFEISFLGIKLGLQYQGYGKLIINYLKEYLKRNFQCFYILTYADFSAVLFFQKQGFSTNFRKLRKKYWRSCLKNYTASKLMECYIIPEINYLIIELLINKKKNVMLEKINKQNNHLIKHKCLKYIPKICKNITGISKIDLVNAFSNGESFFVNKNHFIRYSKMAQIIFRLFNHGESEPFRNPVSQNQVSQYYEMIKKPMNLNQMLQKINEHLYEGIPSFVYDFHLIISNCHKFNGLETYFCSMANGLEQHFENYKEEFFSKQ